MVLADARGLRRNLYPACVYEDLRAWPLALRKGARAGLLSDPVDGIFIAEYEQGEIGDVLFRVACNMGLEGIVSKRLDHDYCAGRCEHWVKVKNRAHPAYSRVRDRLLNGRPEVSKHRAL